MNNDNRGTAAQHGSVMVVENALVESTFSSMGECTCLLISYIRPGTEMMEFIELLRLIITTNTVILDSSGSPTDSSAIHKGMYIDAIYSPVMTRSIPPQSNAFLIIVKDDHLSSLEITMDQIVEVDIENSCLYTGSTDDVSSRIRFTISDKTFIRDQTGIPADIRYPQAGQNARIIHAALKKNDVLHEIPALYIQLI